MNGNRQRNVGKHIKECRETGIEMFGISQSNSSKQKEKYRETDREM